RVAYSGASPPAALHAGDVGGVPPRRTCADAGHRPLGDGGLFRTAKEYAIWIPQSVFRRRLGAVLGVFPGHHAVYQRVDYSAAADGGVPLSRKVVEGRGNRPA